MLGGGVRRRNAMPVRFTTIRHVIVRRLRLIDANHKRGDESAARLLLLCHAAEQVFRHYCLPLIFMPIAVYFCCLFVDMMRLAS